ncbi:methyltransferase domain-containing protein [Myxococcus sp. K15C18031901]|uniref:class I SAM-dependent methyltransferase n=1 Tax=Myxococcus dinghuensis TaxID=2906761 RepID=UPI0020A79446|nr:class I SAM-dependent methyltransferase [Myxococcus dinghuensis]MCP3097338.1 methyltransferase domain-containing protein [Myxococcus dinghuensis]
MPPSQTESYLLDYHRRLAGVTSRWLANSPVLSGGSRFSSTYDLLADAVPADPGPRRVLDLACGDGYLLERVARRGLPGTSLVGIDMSADELSLAKARLGATATLVQGRAQALPFDAATFDVVLSHLALMLMDEGERVLAELRRVSKPGGRLAVIVGGTPVPGGAVALFKDLMKPLIAAEPAPPLSLGDRRFRAEAGLRELFGAGFQDVSVEALEVIDDGPPERAWEFLSATYDADQLPAATRAALERSFLAEARSLAHDGGNVACRWGMYRVLATIP